jgi:hypothetical protein
MSLNNYTLGLLKIPVSDLSKSVSFYKDKLHFQEDFFAEEFGWAQFTAGKLEIALYTPGKGGGSSSFCRNLDFHLLLPKMEFSKLADDLLKSGYLSENRVHNGNDGSVFIDVIDPDKNILKIMQC